MKPKKIFKNIEPILKETKNVIQKNIEYNNYYLKENNNFFLKQFPLLIKIPKIKLPNTTNHEIALSEENKKIRERDNSTYSNKKLIRATTNSYLDFNHIRNEKIRSKNLPPLCPFYNIKGDLLPEVVTTAKAFKNSMQNEFNATIFDSNSFDRNYLLKNYKFNVTQRSTCNSIRIQSNSANFSLYNNMLNSYNSYEKILNIQKIEFKNFLNDMFKNEKFEELEYQDSKIFGNDKKILYSIYIEKKLQELKNNEQNEKNNYLKFGKKEKIFECGIKKKKIHLCLNSLSISISEKDGNNKFEYQLPFYLLPIFYSKGIENFKILLTKIIKYDEIENKFELKINNIENEIRSFTLKLLKNCKEFLYNKEDDQNDEVKIKRVLVKSDSKRSITTVKNFLKNTISSSRSKKNIKLANPRKSKNDISSLNPVFNQISNINNNSKNNLSNNKDLFVAGVDISEKIITMSTYEIKPRKDNFKFLNYNRFEFLWTTKQKAFNVEINMPLICVNVIMNKILVKKYIDYELLFFLMQNDFQNWDFYVINYLANYKKFREFLEQVNSINEKYNLNYFLFEPKIKTFSFNNINIVNIISLKDKVRQQALKQSENKFTEENKIQKNDNSENTCKFKNNYIDNNLTSLTKNEEIGFCLNEDNENIKGIKRKSIDSKNDMDNSYINSIITYDGFIAIVTFYDMKNNIANNYKIHLNFYQYRKFLIIEKYVDKISFLIKFLNISYKSKTITFDYEALNNFDENKWIRNLKKYNKNYLNILTEQQKIKENKGLLETKNIKNFAEFVGNETGTFIRVELISPTICIKTINEQGWMLNELYITSENTDKDIFKLKEKSVEKLVNVLNKNLDMGERYISDEDLGIIGNIGKRKGKKEFDEKLYFKIDNLENNDKEDENPISRDYLNLAIKNTIIKVRHNNEQELDP